ncbi:MAG: GNAT family N-acetyltransferase [Paludibacteraceae bacterium]|nr:GNAT family N-acetyltransferase [Paludibacteraceae bacterium]
MKTYTISSGFSAMDFDAVTALLQATYWCKDTSKEDVILSAENSALVVGAFNEDGVLVGYARVVSDKVRLAYVMDVIVAEEYRHQGIASDMLRVMLNQPELHRVSHWLLATKDAHPLYRTFGFDNLKYPSIMMELWKNK